MSVSCRLQKLSREFSAQTQPHKFVPSAVSIRRPFELERRSMGDSVAESGRLRRLHQVSKMFGSRLRAQRSVDIELFLCFDLEPCAHNRPEGMLRHKFLYLESRVQLEKCG
jgi:hypothetical protein